MLLWQVEFFGKGVWGQTQMNFKSIPPDIVYLLFYINWLYHISKTLTGHHWKQ